MSSHLFGKNNPAWIDGLSHGKKYNRDWMKKWRHQNGISKKYNHGLSKTREYKRFYRKIWKYRLKRAGKLSLKTIQIVYEDNIKKYGTLTCYLCLQPIPFGKDHLEHKTPLSRGGSNERGNLDIACQHCNCEKHSQTEAEYRKES